MFWHIRIITIIILLLDHINRILTHGMPLSPCPKMFQYRFDGNEWFGVLSIRQPDADQPLQLKVTLSVRGKPSSAYLGEIELLTRGQFNNNSPLLYKVKFPHSHFPPKLVQIAANNQIICLGATDQGIFLTQIQLEHTRKISFVNDEPPKDMISEIDMPFFSDPEIKTADIDLADSKQMPMPSWTHNPIRVYKDICGVIDKRINFQATTNNGEIPAENLSSTMTTSGAKKEGPKKISVPPVVTSDEIPYLNGAGSTTGNIELPTISRGAWPWLAAIYVNNMTSLAYQCGGTLISSRIVLSAAHCFHMLRKQYTANEVLVFLGRHNLKNWNEEHSLAAPVDEIFLHPEYDVNLNSYDADIAVIVLKHEVRFNTFVRPACLWSGSTKAQYIQGERGIVVGWNLGHPNATSAAGKATVPHIMTAPIVSNEECFQKSEQLRSISSNRTFCAGIVKDMPKTSAEITQIATPCRGDSGAGLMILKNNRWVLRGTVSASLPNSEHACSLNQYVIYTDVADFLDWIYAFIL